jgi:UDP-2-acetamido-2,6-beta-L-arabino-hexul-4-ose reductase
MKIGITGADGLVATHLRAHLHKREDIAEVRLARRDTFRSPSALDGFVAGLDGIVHCAGMNRGEDTEVEQTNGWLAEMLVAAFERTGARPRVVYTNSTHYERDSAYGRGKRAAAASLDCWGGRSGANVCNLILPHVFGEFGRPFYNSVVSTFCYQLANDEVPQIQVDGQLELVHAQDVARCCISALSEGWKGTQRLAGEPLKVSELLARLHALLKRYREDVFPDLRNPLDLRLFNTLRSYLYPKHYPRVLKLHSDVRGNLFEAVKADQGGQIFLSNTHPGVTRGNHFHLRKVERFLVVSGEAEICLRRLFDDKVVTFRVSGELPSYVDMPTFHTHSITNVGSVELQTLFWTNEIFDPQDPDTFAEIVKP